MAIQRREFIKAAISTAALAGLGSRAYAQQQPLESASIILGFPAGSGPDTLARKMADRLRGEYAKTVIVENRTGAGGQISASAVKASKPDGSSILLTPMAMMTVYPHTYKKLPYDPVADFEPVTLATTFDLGFVVGASVPASVRTIPQFMEWAKKNPDNAVVGSGASGSPLHFTGVLLSRAAGVPLTHVPYRGTVLALQDLMTGRLASHVCPLGEVLKHTGDKVRILGTSGAKRSRFAPDIPTFEEQGYNKLGAPEGYAFFLPAKTPSEVVTRLNTAMHKALNTPDIRETGNIFGMEVTPTTPSGLGAHLQAGLKYWGPVVKSIGFTADS